MCLSTAYRLVPDIMTDILGKEIEVPGSIKSMDFVGSKLLIGA